MEVKAVQKFVRMSPRKLRLVVPLLKNLSPAEAIDLLPHTGKRAAELLGKVIKSATASAKEQKISDSDLIFKEIQVTDGPRLKRYRAGARGRVKPYQRKMSHIRVVLTTKEPQPIKKARKNIEKAKSDKKSAMGKGDRPNKKIKTLRTLKSSFKVLKKKGAKKRGTKS